MENLLNYIHSLTAFSPQSWKALQPALTKKTYKKGGYLLEEGEVCNTLFYIDQGYCRSYYVIEGVEKNTAFYFENDLATNIASFGSGAPSVYAIKAGEPLTAILFDKHKLTEASAQAPEIEALGRSCIRRFSTRQQEFARLFQLYSAKERLSYIEQNHPAMLQRIPLTQLSSFLGVARETLSRLRNLR